MIRVATSYSEHPSGEMAADKAAAEALRKSGASSAQTALVFATADHRQDYARMLKIVEKITGAEKVIGASGYGIITEEVEAECRPAVAVMVIASDTLDTSPFLITNLQESNLKAGEALAELIAKSQFTPSAVLLFPDNFSFQSHLFFDGLETTFGYIPIIGGTAAEDGRDEMTHQMAGEEVAYDAVSGLILGGNLRIETGITQACQPFGEPMQITRSDANMIYEIDGRPAYDILLESLSQIKIERADQVFQRVFLGVPLRSFQTDFSKSHYLVRNIMGINAKKGLLACAAPVEQGEFVTFAVRDPERAKQDLAGVLDDLQYRLHPSRPIFGFYFNCCARGESLYGKPNVDISMIRSTFPNIPLIGFFTYGEIAPLDHVNHLHHYSGVLALVAEN